MSLRAHARIHAESTRLRAAIGMGERSEWRSQQARERISSSGLEDAERRRALSMRRCAQLLAPSSLQENDDRPGERRQKSEEMKGQKGMDVLKAMSRIAPRFMLNQMVKMAKPRK